ncbi:hypothetical protein H5410_030030 [Solanum commersonii]|uniref:Uncharacterized protein n=1 Tax=Solanum commersonii TaxID=4109 RepID=A0A9J5YHF4_SOLCO|nr:hypothetical protein H5410_030030 [Solanum commersonii]
MLGVAYTYKESITMQFNSHNVYPEFKLNDNIKPEETPDLVTCQNSIKLLAKEMYDKYCSLDNVENL